MSRPHPPRVIPQARRLRDTDCVNPRDRLRAVGRRVTDPAEELAQQVTERVVELVVNALDVNELAARIDVNDVVQRIDMDALIEKTDLGAVIASSSGGMAAEALDAVRSGAVGLDKFVDRWVRRVIRPKQPWPAAPPALLAARAEP